MTLDLFISALKSIKEGNFTIDFVSKNKKLEESLKKLMQESYILNTDEDLNIFLNSIESIRFKKGRMSCSIYGIDMIEELNDSYREDNIIEFSNFSISDSGVTFMFDSKDLQKSEVYAMFDKYDEVNNRTLKSLIIPFSNNFSEFLDKIIYWINSGITEEQLLLDIELQ